VLIHCVFGGKKRKKLNRNKFKNMFNLCNIGNFDHILSSFVSRIRFFWYIFVNFAVLSIFFN